LEKKKTFRENLDTGKDKTQQKMKNENRRFYDGTLQHVIVHILFWNERCLASCSSKPK